MNFGNKLFLSSRLMVLNLVNNIVNSILSSKECYCGILYEAVTTVKLG